MIPLHGTSEWLPGLEKVIITSVELLSIKRVRKMWFHIWNYRELALFFLSSKSSKWKGQRGEGLKAERESQTSSHWANMQRALDWNEETKDVTFTHQEMIAPSWSLLMEQLRSDPLHPARINTAQFRRHPSVPGYYRHCCVFCSGSSASLSFFSWTSWGFASCANGERKELDWNNVRTKESVTLRREKEEMESENTLNFMT